MITSANEVLYDSQAIRVASSAGTADDGNSSSTYTFANRHQAGALDESCGAHVTLMVTESFADLTNMNVQIYHKIEGAGWVARRDLTGTVALANLTAGAILFDGMIAAPLGDTAAANLTVMVKFDLTFTGTIPTAGKLFASFATEAGMGTGIEAGAFGDTNVAALQIPTGSGIAR